jgi:hypothetical protein
MPFVHSLVKAKTNGKAGWCAPAELGESAPHYVSFVVPVNQKGEFFHEYICETITAIEQDKRIESHELVQQGSDSFVLHLDGTDLRFTLRPGSAKERQLPYIGNLKHEDFQYSFMELEPEDPEKLDRLCDEKGTFVIGCEPFSHYAGVSKLKTSP